MIDEVKRLHEEGVSWTKLESFGLEYKYIAQFLQGKTEGDNLSEQYGRMKEEIKIKSRQYAKRQRTWFKRVLKKN
mgnify:FL=1